MKYKLFSSTIVSKSLLIVLGTLTTPAMICRGKCRVAGLNLSRNAWNNPEERGVVHTSHRPFTSIMTCLLWYPILPTLKQRGKCGHSPHLPLTCFISFIPHLQIPFSAFLRIVPCGGLPLSRLSISIFAFNDET